MPTPGLAATRELNAAFDADDAAPLDAEIVPSMNATSPAHVPESEEVKRCVRRTGPPSSRQLRNAQVVSIVRCDPR